MITLEHIKTLGGVEFKVLSYLYMQDFTLSITQKELSKILLISDRQIRRALKTLEERGILSYKREPLSKEKSVIQVH